jgi:hypothetical protein
MQLYHGSNEAFNEVTDDGLFGGIFASSDESVALSHGDVLHVIDLENSEILTQQELSYHIDSGKVKQILIDNLDAMTSEELEVIYDAVVEDLSIHELDLDADRICSIFYSTDIGEASWQAQRIRGVIANSFGYKAVEMEDEHGRTYLVLPGTKIQGVKI